MVQCIDFSISGCYFTSMRISTNGWTRSIDGWSTFNWCVL